MTVEQDLNDAVGALESAANSLNTTTTTLVGKKAALETLVANAATHAADSKSDADRSDTTLTETLGARNAAQTAEANANAIADSDITSALLSYGITNVVAISVMHTPGHLRDRWTWQGWYEADRPTGNWLGSVADRAAGIAASTQDGDYFFSVADQFFYEVAGAGSNSVFRGFRASIPATMLIVLRETGTVRSVMFFDCDSPDIPMWMAAIPATSRAFWQPSANATYSGVACAPGLVALTQTGTSGALNIIDFAQDKAHLLWNSSAGSAQFPGNLADPTETAVGWASASTVNGAFASGPLVNRSVNAVALYVDPQAPIDPATGLPRPVIACATDGGVSVILEDGTVRNSSSTAAINRAALPDGTLLYTLASGQIAVVPAAAWRSASFSPAYTLDFGLGDLQGIAPMGGNLAAHDEGDDGLSVTRFAGHQSDVTTALLASDYALPPYPLSSIALALSSTDTTDLVGASVFDVDFSTYADQAAAEADGWVFETGWSLVGGVAKFDASVAGAGVISSLNKPASGIAGAYYRLAATVQNLVNVEGNEFFLASSVGTVSILEAGDYHLPETEADGTSQSWLIRSASQTEGDETLEVTKMSLVRVEPDRSGNNAGPIAVGTLTRAPVAAGAKIPAFSGFSASNYLEHADDHFQPGTGDWSITRIIKRGGPSEILFDYATYSGAYVGSRISIYTGASEALFLRVSDDGIATTDDVNTGHVPLDAGFEPITAIRRSGIFEVWASGRLIGSVAVSNAAGSLSGGAMRTGLSAAGSGAWSGEISSIMLDANYAPTAEQIKEQHRILAAWHSEDADPTLLSDTVDALAYDEDTDKLYVSGPAGTTVVHGSTLTRDTTLTSADSQLTSDDHNAVAGGGGILALASVNELRLSLPALALRDRLLREGSLPKRGIGTQRIATTNATPTVAAAVSIQAGEIRSYRATVKGNQAGNPGGQSAMYRVEWTARRPLNGNVAILGTPTVTVIHETTGTMDATLGANTTDQLCEITVTGVAATDIVWETRIEDLGEVQ